MAATNSPLTFKMHQCRCRHGFRAFFQTRSNGFGSDVLDEAQLDGFTRQHAQRPVVVPVRNRAAGNGNEAGLPRLTS
jgi:hypothetical protein